MISDSHYFYWQKLYWLNFLKYMMLYLKMPLIYNSLFLRFRLLIEIAKLYFIITYVNTKHFFVEISIGKLSLDHSLILNVRFLWICYKYYLLALSSKVSKECVHTFVSVFVRVDNATAFPSFSVALFIQMNHDLFSSLPRKTHCL